MLTHERAHTILSRASACRGSVSADGQVKSTLEQDVKVKIQDLFSYAWEFS